MPAKTYQSIVTDDGAGRGSKRGPLYTSPGAPASYRAVFDNIAPANNKYMAVIFNNGNTTQDVVIQRVRVQHTNVASATGVLLVFELRRISAMTTGTAVTAVADDPETDTLPATILCDHNSSSVSDVSGGLLDRFVVTAEEEILAADNLLLARAGYYGSTVYVHEPGMRGITLSGTTAANKGLAIKNVTSSTEGTITIIVDFTVEAT